MVHPALIVRTLADRKLAAVVDEEGELLHILAAGVELHTAAADHTLLVAAGVAAVVAPEAFLGVEP